jgi:hypothetical protein
MSNPQAQNAKEASEATSERKPILGHAWALYHYIVATVALVTSINTIIEQWSTGLRYVGIVFSSVVRCGGCYLDEYNVRGGPIIHYSLTVDII